MVDEGLTEHSSPTLRRADYDYWMRCDETVDIGRMTSAEKQRSEENHGSFWLSMLSASR